MRNGNLACVSGNHEHRTVLTVPMRNGNYSLAASVFHRMPVLTVPMRNGNAEVENLQKLVVGSYRTYEEWKHDVDLKTTYKFVSSYRTYEEWKQ